MATGNQYTGMTYSERLTTPRVTAKQKEHVVSMGGSEYLRKLIEEDMKRNERADSKQH